MLTEFQASQFRFKVDTSRVLDVDIQWFIAMLHRWVTEGERFQHGETIQLGWGLLTVQANSDGSLSLLEPDYVSMPVDWVNGVTQTLTDLRTQKDVSESYFEPDETAFPSFRDHCIVCNQLKDAAGIVMERVAASPPDSGWFIGCADSDHDHNNADQLQRVSLYEAVLQNLRARKFIALPPGTLVENDGQRTRVYHVNALVKPKRGSFVARSNE